MVPTQFAVIGAALAGFYVALFFRPAEYPDTGCAQADVRLTYRDSSTATGNLQICVNNTWQSVCVQSLSDYTLLVACRALGFTSFNRFSLFPSLVEPMVQPDGPTFQNLLQCSEEDQGFSSCSITENRAESATCSHTRVECLGEQAKKYTGRSVICCFLL